MRARLVALLLVGFLLAPLPALAAAPERAETESPSWMEIWFSRLASSIFGVFGSRDSDPVALIAADSSDPPAPPPPQESSSDPEDDGDLGPAVDPNG